MSPGTRALTRTLTHAHTETHADTQGGPAAPRRSPLQPSPANKDTPPASRLPFPGCPAPPRDVARPGAATEAPRHPPPPSRPVPPCPRSEAGRRRRAGAARSAGLTALPATMGKSNSKLKPEVVEELTRKTYCECTGRGERGGRAGQGRGPAGCAAGMLPGRVRGPGEAMGPWRGLRGAAATPETRGRPPPPPPPASSPRLVPAFAAGSGGCSGQRRGRGRSPGEGAGSAGLCCKNSEISLGGGRKPTRQQRRGGVGSWKTPRFLIKTVPAWPISKAAVTIPSF